MGFGDLSGSGWLAGARVRLVPLSLFGVMLLAPGIVSPVPAALLARRWSLPGNLSRPAAIRAATRPGRRLELVALASVMVRSAAAWMRDRTVTNEGKLGHHDAHSR
jgi:hypothetical protein